MILLDTTTFLGRLHPLIVHLPIGFLLLAILLEWYGYFTKKEFTGPVSFAWLLGSISCIFAALFGWFLASTGLYVEEELFVHRWLGVAFILIGFVGFYLKRNPQKFGKPVQTVFNVLVIILLSVEGHQGGNLTHGEDYLTAYAPGFVSSGKKEKKSSGNSIERSPDSVLVYQDLIAPIFQEKCVACHNTEVAKGGLNMEVIDSLKKGGLSGNTLVAGNPKASELFKRISMSPKKIKYMPPTKDVLTYNEVKLVEWWIEQGASFKDTLVGLEVDKDIQDILLKDYLINTKPRPWYTKVNLPALDTVTLNSLEKKGFLVRKLGEDNNLLDITFTEKILSEQQFSELEKVSEYITWLSLSGTEIESGGLGLISRFKNLTRLELNDTNVSCSEVTHFSSLEHLEALNLYGTSVQDDCLSSIGNLTELKRVYLGNTEVTEAGVQKLKQANENLKVFMPQKQL
ncbi:DUF2231 domain-containing protein [Galbibacter mesophilus]|uniref:DUF2231 domain-containing protein n=1 Tax=Galbibacter mesophilus TaxID=379069 RepID=UPI001920150B|nr:DUF2231 domain-containing protein [Galbibacter mesophilus]MCM5663388.1 hypothetical protein [Galbibacter mesophilus]